MILSGHEIRRQMGEKIKIEPFDEALLNPNSYNLTLHNELMTYEEVVLDMRKANRVRRLAIPPEGLVLSPHQLYLARTAERTETHGYVPMIEGHHRRHSDPAAYGKHGARIELPKQRGRCVKALGQHLEWRSVAECRKSRLIHNRARNHLIERTLQITGSDDVAREERSGRLTSERLPRVAIHPQRRHPRAGTTPRRRLGGAHQAQRPADRAG